jgi:hypothetical protein
MLILAMGMPEKAQDLQTTQYWYVLFMAQVPLQLLALFLHIVVYTEDSVTFCIKTGKKDEAIRGLRRVYPTESSATIESIYEKELEALTSSSSGQQDNVWNIFTQP